MHDSVSDGALLVEFGLIQRRGIEQVPYEPKSREQGQTPAIWRPREILTNGKGCKGIIYTYPSEQDRCA
jgi:hypothetical protein